MRGYAETTRCRAAYLLGYFGSRRAGTCGACDNCRAGPTEDTEVADGPYGLHTAVAHEAFGSGTVTDVEGDRVTVLFEDLGYRTLSPDLVESEGPLRAVE